MHGEEENEPVVKKKRQKRLEKEWKKREPKCGLRERVHVLASACVCEGEKVRMYNTCVVAGKKGGGKSTPSFKKEGKNTAC